MKRKHRGLFKPKYRAKNGTVKESSIWHGEYICRGCGKHPLGGGRHREPLGTKKFTEAVRELDSRRGSAERREPLNIYEIRFTQLLEGVKADCVSNGNTGIGLQETLDKHILPYFAKYSAIELVMDESIIKKFISQKRQEERKRKDGTIIKGYSASTINGMLAVISRAFSLAKNRIPYRPIIERLETHNARKGFFTEAEIQTFLEHLSDDMRRPITVAYETAWRMPSEVLSRQKRHLDMDRGLLMLEAYETKNKRPRIFPLTTRLRSVFEEQLAFTKTLERKQGRLIQWLFHDDKGEPLVAYFERRRYWKPTRYFRKCWRDACKEAKLVGRIPHDLRRSGVRRFRAVGIDDWEGMQLSGHQTRSMYDRYAATTENDLREAVQKLERQNNDKVMTKSS